jgi:hypothetical protein
MTPVEVEKATMVATAVVLPQYRLDCVKGLELLGALGNGEDPEPALRECRIPIPPDSVGIIARPAWPHTSYASKMGAMTTERAQDIVRAASDAWWWKSRGPVNDGFNQLSQALFTLKQWGQPPGESSLRALAALCREHTSSHKTPALRMQPAGPLAFWLAVIHLRIPEGEQWCTNIECPECHVE